jgi:predicted flap endonuclease-1-like 5' DNA nuclease
VPTVGRRAELADRDARIHELECQLEERTARLAELETDLRTWKYRIAPMALHMKIRRGGPAAAEAVSLREDDDLKRIQGIGRGLEKKLRAAGITEFAQLAAMSPAELANLAVRVGSAASRPERDGWAEQAAALCAAQAGAAPLNSASG